MDVSAIIITRDTRELTASAIRATLAAQKSLAVEILVVDNGSSDDTAAALPREFPPIHLIRSDRNLGFARAVNRAAASAHGEFLLLLNSDARPAEDALTRAVEWMRANPDGAVAGAQLLNADGSRQNSIANFPTLATELLNKSLLRRLWPDKYPGKERAFTAPVDVETVVGAFMLIRRKDWDAHGGLDERFFFFFEETDFCRQVRRAGRRVVHLPEVRVWHEQGATARKVSAAARIEYWRSRYAYFKKNSGFATRAVLAAGLWLRLFVDGLAALLLVVLSVGHSPRWADKWRVFCALRDWHLHGCPADAGLPR
jgi:GT2 family glycosyltransferase